MLECSGSRTERDSAAVSPVRFAAGGLRLLRCRCVPGVSAKRFADKESRDESRSAQCSESFGGAFSKRKCPRRVIFVPFRTSRFAARTARIPRSGGHHSAVEYAVSGVKGDSSTPSASSCMSLNSFAVCQPSAAAWCTQTATGSAVRPALVSYLPKRISGKSSGDSSHESRENDVKRSHGRAETEQKFGGRRAVRRAPSLHGMFPCLRARRRKISFCFRDSRSRYRKRCGRRREKWCRTARRHSTSRGNRPSHTPCGTRGCGSPPS